MINRRRLECGGRKEFGGGGIQGLILGPSPTATQGETARSILSWAPYAGTAIDIENAVKNPTTANLTWAGLSTGLDALSFGYASRAMKGIKQLRKVLSKSIEETAKAEKRFNTANKVFRQAPNNKNYKTMSKAQQEYWDAYAKTKHVSDIDAFNGSIWRELAEKEAEYNGRKLLFGLGGTEVEGMNFVYDNSK